MTFLDNIRAIHNFYCINTNNLIEYSIFVENAQTMKKTFIFILWSLFSVAVNAQNFNDYFEDKTLRVDYIFTGNATKQEIYLDELSSLPKWARAVSRRVSTLNSRLNITLGSFSAASGIPLAFHESVDSPNAP